MFKDKYNYGRELRKKVPRSSHSEWTAPASRPTVKEMLDISESTRVKELIPVRHDRMKESPSVFFRATASIMAYDLSHTPTSNIIVQASGDCHLKNFGVYATPERNLILDMNDFDETHPASFEWDLKRLVTSFILSGRDRGFSDSEVDNISRRVLNGYRESMTEFANMNFLDFWYFKFDVKEIMKKSRSKLVRSRFEKEIRKIRKQSQGSVLFKMASNKSGKFNITDTPPLIVHPEDHKESFEMISSFMEEYKSTLQDDRKHLIEQYRIEDVALKVVGVGSVGTRCFVVLLLNDNNEPLFIQVKEANQSVLEPYTTPSVYKHHGERVVNGQRLMQSASDILLGWSTSTTGTQFFFRQLKDKKFTPSIDEYPEQMFLFYAGYCGSALAKAHCKSGDGAVIAGYIGKSDVFINSIIKFSRAYAKQTEKDYAEFMKRIKSGEISCS